MQHTHYYIDAAGVKDGPHDLVAVMRRIRTGKVGPQTGIYTEGADAPVAASEVDEIALFFNRQNDGVTLARKLPTFGNIIAGGWHFTIEHNVMTVYAGGMLLMSMLLAMGLMGTFGTVIGGMLGWIIFVTFHNLYLIFALRLFRGQTFSSDFINHHLAPALPALLAACALLALMMAGGLFLLVVPCLAVAVLYIFVPFLMLDRQYNLIEAMQASRLLLQKRNRSYLGLVTALVVLHLVCLFLIIPIPLTLPLFSAALAELYEDMTAA